MVVMYCIGFIKNTNTSYDCYNENEKNNHGVDPVSNSTHLPHDTSYINIREKQESLHYTQCKFVLPGKNMFMSILLNRIGCVLVFSVDLRCHSSLHCDW